MVLWNSLDDNITIDRIFYNLPINYYSYINNMNSFIIKQQVEYINKTINIINNN
mgnify:CR=1 FL=1